MSSVSGWVLTIAGVCLFSVIIDLCLPEGKTNNTIKNYLAYVMVLVVILPLPSLLKSDLSFDSIFASIELNIQDDYIYNINQSKLDKWTIQIEDDIESRGINGITISISANIFETDMEINAVYVDLYNIVINENIKNIDIKTEVIEAILKQIYISKEKVIFYE